MNPYALQPGPQEQPTDHTQSSVPVVAHDTEPRQTLVQQDLPQRQRDPVLQTLTMLQRQQAEQTRLLQQLLHEVAALKTSQSEQSTTVTKLDRRMRRARFFRISWIVLRTMFIAGSVASLVYIIGIDQLQAMWARLVWLFT